MRPPNLARMRKALARTKAEDRPRQTSWTLTDQEVEQALEYDQGFLRNLDIDPPDWLRWKWRVDAWAKAAGVRVEWLGTHGLQGGWPTGGTTISWRVRP